MKFTELSVKQEILQAAEKAGYTELTEIQEKAIPTFLAREDIIAQAPTGTGKTCAFGIPLLNNIDTEKKELQGVILCPTRELAVQIGNEIQKMGAFIRGLSVLTIYGGQDIRKQFLLLKKNPQIIIATPGRMIDHIERKTINMSTVTSIVLDEADEMLNMGFREDIDIIVKKISNNVHQTALFSATMSKEIIEISKKYQKDPKFFKVQLNENDLPAITQYFIAVAEANKVQTISTLITSNNYYLTIIFTNTRRRAKMLVNQLSSLKFRVDALHSDLKQNARDRVMRRFRAGELQILVATDIAARGIDVSNIDAVINYDVPKDMEYYVHRIGRTARAKRTGTAYTLISTDLRNSIRKIERTTNTKLEEFKVALDNPEAFAEKLGVNNSQERRFERSKQWAENPDNVRFFVNLGKRDGLDNDSFKDLIMEKTALKSEDFKDVIIFDNFGFIQTEKDKVEEALKLNGEFHNERKINIEVAAKREPRKSFGSINSSRGNGGPRRFDRSSQFGDRSRGGFNRDRGSNRGSSRPSFGERRERPSFDGERKERPAFGERRERSSGSGRPSSFGPKKRFDGGSSRSDGNSFGRGGFDRRSKR